MAGGSHPGSAGTPRSRSSVSLGGRPCGAELCISKPAGPGKKAVRSPRSSGRGTTAPGCPAPAGSGGCTDPRQRLCRAPALLEMGRGGGWPPPPPSQPVPSAVQPRGRRERGRQVCPARRHRSRRPPGPRRPPPRGRSSSCGGARASAPASAALPRQSRGEAVPLLRSEREDRGKDKGVPRWRASPSPGAALVERGIAGGAAGTGLRRVPAAIGRASRAPGGTEGRRFAPCPRRRGGGGAPANARRSDRRLCPQPAGAGRPRSAGAARSSRWSRRGSRRSPPLLSPQSGRVCYSRSGSPGSPGRRGAAVSGVRGQVRPVRRDRLALSPALQGGRLCCKQEPARYINIIYPTVQEPSGCLPFPRRRLPASAPRALLPRTLQTAEPQPAAPLFTASPG